MIPIELDQQQAILTNPTNTEESLNLPSPVATPS